jgi:hypothetical protein
MLFTGLLGTAAVGFFYINTYYWAAIPLWLLSAVFALSNPRSRR